MTFNFEIYSQCWTGSNTSAANYGFNDECKDTRMYLANDLEN